MKETNLILSFSCYVECPHCGHGEDWEQPIEPSTPFIKTCDECEKQFKVK
ncbi:MAG: hypothetical protein GY750_20800 [Lentisphaerae bacterium]|nr:hypothetical protein [Lentisphaerota bacterium]